MTLLKNTIAPLDAHAASERLTQETLARREL
jgi:hypothetical protein